MAELWQTLIDNSGAVVAVFTVVLAVTTIIYVVVSMKLLKQSKITLLADITLRVMGTFREEIKGIKTVKDISQTASLVGWTKAYCKTFVGIDKRMGRDIGKVVDVCLHAAYEETVKGEKYLKERDKLHEEFKKFKKKIKENKGSGTS